MTLFGSKIKWQQCLKEELFWKDTVKESEDDLK